MSLAIRFVIFQSLHEKLVADEIHVVLEIMGSMAADA